MQTLFNQFIIKIIPFLPLFLVRLIAGRYVAGEKTEDVIKVIKTLNKKGFYATVDILGEHTSNFNTAQEITREYQNLLVNIHDQKLNCNISLKPSHLGLDISKELLLENMFILIETAKQYNQFIRIDMENSEVAESTLNLYKECKKQYNKIGTVLQAYLFRSENDLKILCTDSNCNLRLCKGIYKESPENAIQKRYEINNNFLKLLRYAFENKIYVGIATHDLDLIEKTYIMIKELNVTTDNFEFQVLYGVPMSGWLEKHIKNGYKVRVYVPFGKDWYAYSIRRLKENPGIAGYILKDIFRK